MQPLHAMPGIGDSITLTVPDCKGTLGFQLSRVLATAVSRPPAAPTA